MARRRRVFVEVSDFMPLDRLIGALAAIRDGLPSDAEPQLTMRGDDVFGRQLQIAYFRDLTEEEAALEARYVDAAPPSRPNRGRTARSNSCN